MLSPEELERQGVALRGLARSLLADAHAADDVVQEAFVRALERPPRNPASAGAWLRRVVRGLAIDGRRARSRRAQVERPIGEVEPAAPDPSRGIETQISVLEAVRALPEPYRGIVWQRWFEGLPPREIAARSGEPVKTVKTRLHRALAMLRERLDAEHGGDRSAWALPLAALALPEALTSAAAGGAASATTVASPWALPLTLWTLLMKTSVIRLSAVALVVVGALAVGFAVWGGDPDPQPVPDPRQPTTRIADAGAETSVDARVQAAGSNQGDGTERIALTEPDLAPDTGALRFEVLWHDRSPAPDIAVILRRATPGLPRVVFERGVTDAEGVVTFEGLDPGNYEARTDRDMDAGVEVVAGETTEQQIVLDRGVDVRGVVVHADGSPAPGAVVWLQSYFLDWASGRALALAGAGGRFALRSIPAGSSLGALAASGGHDAPSELVDLDLVERTDDTAEVRLVLGRSGGRIEGRIVAAEDGAPLAGARIAFGARLRNLEHRGRQYVERWGLRTVETDADGRFAVDGLAVGEVAYTARDAGRGLLRGSVEVLDGKTATLELALDRSATIHGRVTDSQGRPLENVTVHAYDAAPSLDFVQGGQIDFALAFGHVAAVTAADGSYRLAGVTPGTVHLVVQKSPQLDPARRHGGGGSPYLATTLEVAPNSEVEWNPELGEGRVLEGRALYRDGHPLAGEFVSIRTSEGKSAGTIATDAKGRFRFVSLTEPLYHVYVQVFDKPRDAPSVEQSNVVPDQGPIEIRASFDKPVELEEGKVTGRLVDAGGRLTNPKAATVLLVTESFSWYTANLDEEGRFRFDRVDPGRLRLVVMDGETMVHEVEAFELAPAEERDVGTITTSGVVAEVRVKIRRAPGAEEFEPSISLRREDRVRGVGVKPGGVDEVVIGNIEPGDYRWTLYCPGGVSGEGEITLREGAPAELEIELVPGAAVKFDVRVAADADLGDVTIVYERDGTEFHRYTYKPDSVLDFRRYYVGSRLPPGEWRAVMTSTTGLSAEARFSITSVDEKPTPVLELK